MKIRTMIGLTLVGTALYAHKQHGGELSVDSVKTNLKRLWAGIQNKAIEVTDKAEHLADKAEDKAKDAAKTAKPVLKDAAGAAKDKAKAPTSPDESRH